MKRTAFDRAQTVLEWEVIFKPRIDALGKAGIYRIENIVAELRMLAFGLPVDSLYEYLYISDSSSTASMNEFCKPAVKALKKDYLRQPAEEDLTRIMGINVSCRFPRCLGSFHCKHWRWKSCPLGWIGQFIGKEQKPTVNM